MWGHAAAGRIKKLGLERGSIGVCGLAGVCRAPEGVIPYTTMKHLLDDLPGAKFSNATALAMSVRMVKSAEEVSFLEKATAIAEAEAIAAKARPGMREYEVHAEAVYAALERGGEYPTMFRWRASHMPERQARDFVAAVKAAGKPVQPIVGEGYNHFEMPETFCNPHGLLGRAALERMKLAPARPQS